MRIEEADFMMRQYGLWCRSGLDRLGYQSPNLAIMREMGALPKQAPAAIISDERALLIDGLITDLYRHQPTTMRALLAYYALGRGYREVAKELSCSFSEARVATRGGLAAIAVCFTEHRNTASCVA